MVAGSFVIINIDDKMQLIEVSDSVRVHPETRDILSKSGERIRHTENGFRYRNVDFKSDTKPVFMERFHDANNLSVKNKINLGSEVLGSRTLSECSSDKVLYSFLGVNYSTDGANINVIPVKGNIYDSGIICSSKYVYDVLSGVLTFHQFNKYPNTVSNGNCMFLGEDCNFLITAGECKVLPAKFSKIFQNFAADGRHLLDMDGNVYDTGTNFESIYINSEIVVTFNNQNILIKTEDMKLRIHSRKPDSIS